MNLFKKATATLALVTLLSGVFSTGVSAYSAAEVEAANRLAQAGIIVDHTADPAGYNLDQNVLRQEIAAVARGIAGLPKKTTCDGVFADVSATKPNDWACYTVEQLADNGLIALNEKFNPEQNITKSEAIGMMVKAAFGDEYKYDASLDTTWQQQVVAFAVKKGVTSNFVNYDTPATRGFVFQAGANAMESATDNKGEDDMGKIMCDLLGICDEDKGGDDKGGDDKGGDDKPVVVTGAGLEVGLNPKSPAARTVPKSGLVPFGKFDFTAGKEDVSINSITLKREGLSNRTDIRRVYFERKGVRVSNRSNVGIDETVTVSFTPALVVKAGSTETLDLIVELSDSADIGAEHRFSIPSETDISASAKVGGVYPIRTNLMRLGSYEVKKVEVREVSGDVTYSVGQDDALLSEFRLTTNGDRDNLFKSITLRNAGDADVGSSVSNLALYSDGKKVSTEFAVVGRDLTIYVNDVITNGRSQNYQLRGNITGAERNNEKYQFEVRNSSDVTVVEVESGFSAPIDLSNVVRWGIVTVEGGDFLVSRDTSYTLNQTVSAATSDVVLWSAKATLREDVTLENVAVEFDAATASLENFSSLRLIVADATIATYTPNTSTTKKITFEANFTVKKGVSNMKIVGNLRNNVANNSTFKVEKVTIGSADARYVSNDEKAEIKGSAAGILTTVADGNINLVRNDGIDSSAIVAGMNNKLLLGFSLRANDVSDIKITGISPQTSTLKGGISLSDISNIRLYRDNVLVSTRNNFDFNNLDITIKKNTSSNFQVLADFTTSIATGSELQLTIAPTNVNARNIDSNKQVYPGNTITSQLFKFSDEGRAIVTENTNQPNASIITPSKTSETAVMQFDIEAKDDNIRVTDVYVTNTIDGLAVLQRQLDALLKEQTELPDATTKALADAVTASGAIPASITTASGQLLQLANTLRAKHAALPYADVAAVKVDAVKVTGNDILMGGAITSYNTTFADTAFTGVIDYINVIGYGLNPLGTAVAIDLTNPTNSLVVNNAVAAYNVAWANYQAKLDRVGTLTTEIANKRIEIASAEAAGGTIDLSSALRTSTLYMSNGRQVTGETIGRNVIHFQFGTEGIIINRDAKIKGEVRVAFHDSSTRSAELFQLSIMSGAIHDETPGTKNSMRILSESTGTEITRSAVDVNSKVHLLARSKPTVAMTSGFVSNSTELYRFTVTADSNNDLTLSGLTLQIGNKGVGNGKIEIRRDTINGSLVGERDITSATSTAGYVGDLAFIVNKDNGKISAGTTVTFYVQMASTGNTPTEGSREVRVVDAQYFDNVDTINQKTIIVKDYNVGIPTQISSFRYNN